MLPNPIARLLALGGELAPTPPGAPRRKFDLAHMRVLLHALGDPHSRFPSVLIAGTNGKGSTAATLASILQAGGSRTGLYTSPHLEHPNERIRIDGVPITDETLSALFLQVESAAARLVTEAHLPHTPSFFETITAIAFLYFAQHSVGIAVLEVGLGGRLDATNVVEPTLSILTDISLDHQEWLGTTIAAITREKCGILRQNGTLVTLPQHPEANQAIGEAAVPLQVHAISATDYLPLRSAPSSSPVVTALRNRYLLYLPAETLGGGTLTVDSPLAGEHQQRNLGLAIASAIFLHEQRGFPLTKASLEEGIRATSWPARLQLLQPSVAGSLPPVLLDAAHNPAGAWALRAALSALASTGPRTLIFGCMQDKAIDELAQILFPIFDQVFLTRSSSSRAADPQRLAQAAERTGAAFQQFQSPGDALRAALARMPADGLLTIAGSIALLGECRPALSQWR